MLVRIPRAFHGIAEGRVLRAGEKVEMTDERYRAVRATLKTKGFSGRELPVKVPKGRQGAE